MIAIIGLLLKAAFLAFGSWLLWDSHPESAIILAIAAVVFLIMDIAIAYMDRREGR